MEDDDLVVHGLGDVAIQTTTGALVVSGQVEANALQSLSAQIDQLQVNPGDGVSGAGFERFNQAPDIIRLDNDMDALASRVTVNERDIQHNVAGIEKNKQDIRKNLTDLVDLNVKVGANSRAIAANRSRINQNASAIQKLRKTPDPSASCTPSRASVIAANPGRLSCGSDCRSCGYWRSRSTSYTYKSRNLATLKCDSHSIKIYSTCCFVSNGLCDGWCEYGVKKC